MFFNVFSKIFTSYHLQGGCFFVTHSISVDYVFKGDLNHSGRVDKVQDKTYFL
jgi:hypothetical protein